MSFPVIPILLCHTTAAPAGKEGWEKLLSRLQTPSHADRAMELLLADARLREQSAWDWATHGYGQTAFLLVQVGGLRRDGLWLVGSWLPYCGREQSGQDVATHGSGQMPFLLVQVGGLRRARA